MMVFTAKSRFIRYSPYKLRPLVDVIRGKNVDYALSWLRACALKKAVPVGKIIASAAANAKQGDNIDPAGLIIKEIRVDEGPMRRYYKPGAMGRSSAQTKRLSHLSVWLEPIDSQQES